MTTEMAISIWFYSKSALYRNMQGAKYVFIEKRVVLARNYRVQCAYPLVLMLITSGVQELACNISENKNSINWLAVGIEKQIKSKDRTDESYKRRLRKALSPKMGTRKRCPVHTMGLVKKS